MTKETTTDKSKDVTTGNVTQTGDATTALGEEGYYNHNLKYNILTITLSFTT